MRLQKQYGVPVFPSGKILCITTVQLLRAQYIEQWHNNPKYLIDLIWSYQILLALFVSVCSSV